MQRLHGFERGIKIEMVSTFGFKRNRPYVSHQIGYSVTLFYSGKLQLNVYINLANMSWNYVFKMQFL